MTIKRLRRDLRGVAQLWSNWLTVCVQPPALRGCEGLGRKRLQKHESAVTLRRLRLVYVVVISIAVTDAQLKGTEDMFWLMVSVCGQPVPLLWACGECEHRESRILWWGKCHDGLSTPQVLPPVRAYSPLTPFGP